MPPGICFENWRGGERAQSEKLRVGVVREGERSLQVYLFLIDDYIAVD